MDHKVADLRKKLNKLKYETRMKTDRIARLMKDYEKVVNMNAEMVSDFASQESSWSTFLIKFSHTFKRNIRVKFG